MASERDQWASQLRKGVLELAVLALLADEAKYGSQLVDELAGRPALEITGGTLYPLLARLSKGGLVATTWVESPAGPPRKYYALSAAGRERLAGLTTEFRAVAAAMTALLGGS